MSGHLIEDDRRILRMAARDGVLEPGEAVCIEVERIVADLRKRIADDIEAESRKAWQAFIGSPSGPFSGALKQGRYDGLVVAARIARGGAA